MKYEDILKRRKLFWLFLLCYSQNKSITLLILWKLIIDETFLVNIYRREALWNIFDNDSNVILRFQYDNLRERKHTQFSKKILLKTSCPNIFNVYIFKYSFSNIRIDILIYLKWWMEIKESITR